jgi:hypothetical protein
MFTSAPGDTWAPPPRVLGLHLAQRTLIGAVVDGRRDGLQARACDRLLRRGRWITEHVRDGRLAV